MMKLKDLLKEQLEDDEFGQLWRRSDPSFQAGALIVGLRSELGLSQAEFADRARVKRPYIARIEAGEANPTVESLGRLLSAVGYSLRLTAAKEEAGAKSGPDEAMSGLFSQNLASALRRLSQKDA
jgi:transcriptional regulator with XRE-family HTH domain